MALLRTAFLCALTGFLCASGPDSGTGSLSYRVKLRMRGEAAPIETRFTLVSTPVVATRNRVKKPRMGAWRLEAQQSRDAAFSQAMVLARVERMLYLAGPTEQTEPRNLVVRFGDRPCRIWGVKVPPSLNAYAYLVEVVPGLLALNYFSGSFSAGDVATMEIQLETFRMGPGSAPAEDGIALINTLRRMGTETVGGFEDTGIQHIQ